MCAAHIVVS